jgi:hypothetical protein
MKRAGETMAEHSQNTNIPAIRVAHDLRGDPRFQELMRRMKLPV